MKSISTLLVEDDDNNRELLANIFSKKYPDVSIYTAVDGNMGLELFNKHMPDIIVTDMNMPKMGGAEMSNKIRELKPYTKIIVLTGDTGRDVMRDSIAKGLKIDHYIFKPVNFEELFSAVEQCIAEIQNAIQADGCQQIVPLPRNESQ